MSIATAMPVVPVMGTSEAAVDLETSLRQLILRSEWRSAWRLVNEGFDDYDLSQELVRRSWRFHPRESWQWLEKDADICVKKRTKDDYTLACQHLSMIKTIAEMTGECAKFNQLLASFALQHQTKSMLISMLARQVHAFDGV